MSEAKKMVEDLLWSLRNGAGKLPPEAEAELRMLLSTPEAKLMEELSAEIGDFRLAAVRARALIDGADTIDVAGTPVSTEVVNLELLRRLFVRRKHEELN